MELQVRRLSLDLPSLDGLSPRLLTSHHENNYAGAVRRANAIRKQLAQLDWTTAPVFVINGLKREELVAANSAWLHELYFDSLGGDGALPDNGLSIALRRDFGSVEQWRAEFMAQGRALAGGSGWVLLSWSAREGRLINHCATDHTQLLAAATPLLALDMYEHAYHMDFGAQAGAYVEAFMRNLHWAGVLQRYGEAVAADAHAWGVDPRHVDRFAQRVDVRRAALYAAAPDRLADAQWRDPAQLDSWSGELQPTQPVLVYCAHGHDISQSAALALRARGFDAHYVVGGIEACRTAGVTMEPKA